MATGQMTASRGVDERCSLNGAKDRRHQPNVGIPMEVGTGTRTCQSCVDTRTPTVFTGMKMRWGRQNVFGPGWSKTKVPWDCSLLRCVHLGLESGHVCSFQWALLSIIIGIHTSLFGLCCKKETVCVCVFEIEIEWDTLMQTLRHSDLHAVQLLYHLALPK